MSSPPDRIALAHGASDVIDWAGRSKRQLEQPGARAARSRVGSRASGSPFYCAQLRGLSGFADGVLEGSRQRM